LVTVTTVLLSVANAVVDKTAMQIKAINHFISDPLANLVLALKHIKPWKPSAA
jgi:hypothetical protein